MGCGDCCDMGIAFSPRVVREPLLAGTCPLREETHAALSRFPFAVPMRRCLRIGVLRVEAAPVMTVRRVTGVEYGDGCSCPQEGIRRCSRLDLQRFCGQARAFSEGHRAGSAVAVRSHSEAYERISWPWSGPYPSTPTSRALKSGSAPSPRQRYRPDLLETRVSFPKGASHRS